MSKKSAAVGRLASAKAVDAAVTNALITIAISLTAPLPHFGRVISSPSAPDLQAGPHQGLGAFCFRRLLFFRSRSSLAVMRKGTSLVASIASTCLGSAFACGTSEGTFLANATSCFAQA